MAFNSDWSLFRQQVTYVFWQVYKSKVEAFGTSRSLLDINETTKKHAEIVPLMLMHFLVVILCQSYVVLERRQS